MNYYVKGDAANAERIKAAFEKLGYDTGNLVFTSSQLYYTIEGKVELMCYKSLQNLIKSHPGYKELELSIEPKFKVGDWIIRNNRISYVPIQIYGLKKDRYLVTNLLGSKVELMINRQNEFHLWTIQDAKDGDVLALNGKPFIYSYKFGHNYCYIDDCGQFMANFNLVLEGNCVSPAIKEQRDLLFSKMREAGYTWDEKKKELKKIKPHYDIANFHAGMPVLVRDDRQEKWCYALYSHNDNEDSYQFVTAGDNPFIQCIPFEGNEHLLGTTDMPDEMYINW